METKKVNKRDYSVEQAMGGYYYIAPTGSNCPDCDTTVWGGDSAWDDCYDEELANDIYNRWDGELIRDNEFEKWYIDAGDLVIDFLFKKK